MFVVYSPQLEGKRWDMTELGMVDVQSFSKCGGLFQRCRMLLLMVCCCLPLGFGSYRGIDIARVEEEQ